MKTHRLVTLEDVKAAVRTLGDELDSHCFVISKRGTDCYEAFEFRGETAKTLLQELRGASGRVKKP